MRPGWWYDDEPRWLRWLDAILATAAALLLCAGVAVAVVALAVGTAA